MPNLALLLSSVLVALAVVEIGLRMSGFSYPSFYVPDELTAHKFRPNAEGWFREEGETYVRINSDGWRDRLHTKQKLANVKRIAIIGDSYAAAFHVAMQNTFWSVMERELKSCRPFGGHTAEVMNFGVTGYGTLQELLTLKNRVWAYSPDVVVLAFVTGNDMTDNLKSLAGGYPRPYFAKENGALVLDQSFIHSPTYKIKTSWAWRTFLNVSDDLKTFQLVNKAQSRLRDPDVFRTYQLYTTYQQDGIYVQEPGLDDNNIYAPPKTSDWQDAWRVTEELVVAMRDQVEAHGARFVVVTLSNGIQVHPDAQVRKQFMGQLGISDLFYPEKRLRALADREHIELLSLSPALQSYAEQHHVFLHGFQNAYLGLGHWNEQGHEVAGQVIAAHLCSVSTKD